MHTPHNYTGSPRLVPVTCSLEQCFPLTLKLADATFDHSAPFAVFISSPPLEFSPAAALIVLESKSRVSQAYRDKVLFLCEHIALSQRWLTRRTNTLVEGHRVPQLSLHHLHHYPQRKAKSTFISRAIIYLLTLSFLF